MRSNNMRKISIVFTKSLKKFPIGSWIIRAWTSKEYSHVALKFETKVFNSNTYYQASEGMVNYMSETQFLKKHKIVQSFDLYLDDDLYGRIRTACHEEAGAPYGVMQNLGIVICDVLSLVGISATNPFKKGRNCSELLYEQVLVKLGISGYKKDLIKPHHIEKIIKEELSQEYLSF